jgi:hypothetical protein
VLTLLVAAAMAGVLYVGVQYAWTQKEQADAKYALAAADVGAVLRGDRLIVFADQPYTITKIGYGWYDGRTDRDIEVRWADKPLQLTLAKRSYGGHDDDHMGGRDLNNAPRTASSLYTAEIPLDRRDYNLTYIVVKVGDREKVFRYRFVNIDPTLPQVREAVRQALAAAQQASQYAGQAGQYAQQAGQHAQQAGYYVQQAGQYYQQITGVVSSFVSQYNSYVYGGGGNVIGGGGGNQQNTANGGGGGGGTTTTTNAPPPPSTTQTQTQTDTPPPPTTTTPIGGGGGGGGTTTTPPPPQTNPGTTQNQWTYTASGYAVGQNNWQVAGYAQITASSNNPLVAAAAALVAAQQAAQEAAQSGSVTPSSYTTQMTVVQAALILLTNNFNGPPQSYNSGVDPLMAAILFAQEAGYDIDATYSANVNIQPTTSIPSNQNHIATGAGNTVVSNPNSIQITVSSGGGGSGSGGSGGGGGGGSGSGSNDGYDIMLGCMYGTIDCSASGSGGNNPSGSQALPGGSYNEPANNSGGGSGGGSSSENSNTSPIQSATDVAMSGGGGGESPVGIGPGASFII